jgi:uncharacterized lipoprotein YddW (UPF0748 family)
MIPQTAIPQTARFGRREIAAIGLAAAVTMSLTGAAPGWRADVRADDLPGPAREFRAAWIATVANIDWPSRPGLPADVQRAELASLLDQAAAIGLNAVVFQIRPCADAFYASPLEPWSEYLSGTMGRPPEPFYDPLEFAVAEAHARGLELHAWFNPYRVRQSGAKTPAAPTHASQALPAIVRRYGPYLWFDPGEPAAADRFLAVVTDVVRRYDVDGVHIDDYFYPYPIAEDGRDVPFPDAESHARAVAAGGAADRDAWRRDNVDRLVERLWREVKAIKPHVLVGISPFGIWRPGHPPGIEGFDQYAKLHADARKWLREGWLDYLAPQLYWRIDAPAQGYEKLLGWWADENVAGRGLWPGNYTSRVRSDPAAETTARIWEAEEILRQVEATRRHPGGGGNIHFSMKALATDVDGVATKLAAGPYAEPALVPLVRQPDGPPPAEPRLEIDERGVAFSLPAGDRPWRWVVRGRLDDSWNVACLPGSATRHELPAGCAEVAVSAVARDGREGPAARGIPPVASRGR